jgi:DNA-binding transcriptional ArsR family regulator
MQTAVQIVDSVVQATALMDPARLRVLERLREPDSSAGVARALGLPRQRVGYHVRELETAGLLTFVGERKKRNCVERLLQATARSYVVAPHVLGQLGIAPEVISDRFSSTYLLAAATRVLHEVTTLRPRAEAAGKKLPTLALQAEVRFASARSQTEFVNELVATFAALVGKHHDETAPHGRTFRMSLFGHPALPPGPPTVPARQEKPS